MTDATLSTAGAGAGDPCPTGAAAGADAAVPVLPAAGAQTAERLLSEVRAEIGRADTKASVLIGALGMCAGVVLTTYWSHVPVSGLSRFMGMAALLTWACALGFLLFATAPRYRASRWSSGTPLTYFLDIRRAAGSGVLADALRTTEREPLAGLVIALRDTSDIAAAKHRWIRTGLVCFLVGAVALAGSALAAV
ncbi:Pycsar system effector family protein [Streptomyces sp. NPDC002454]|uniref:Pycsar system effector family protein n=1 Tax=Streptomyces sp. NPDC002490 TaxID=3154416 RepID=UPI00332F0059